MEYKRLGKYIREVNVRNRELKVTNLLGLSIEKRFIPSIANTIGTDMSSYKIVCPTQFAYVPVTSRNGDKITIALYKGMENAIISQAYTVFEIIEHDALLPEYLMMWFRRPEFDRYARVTAIGGTTIQMANIQIHPTAEAENHILITEAVRGNGAILVNHEGKRFVNEMDTRDVVSAAILEQTQSEAFLIFDQAVRQSLASIETYANQHLLKEGNTIEELAAAIAIPASSLSATMTRYAAQQKAGTDEDFGRTATQMTAPLETAPYYAVRVTPAIHHTMGGLSVNTETQVLKADGTPIPGLFAAGEVTGGLHGANRLGGNGVADIVVNGRLAGQAAAQRLHH